MADKPGSPGRWLVRGAFAITQCLIAVTIYVAVEDGPTATPVALIVLTGALMSTTLASGLYLDVVRPHLRRRRRDR